MEHTHGEDMAIAQRRTDTRRMVGSSKRRKVLRQSQYTERVNLLLTRDQYLRVTEQAVREGRPLPNLIRRLIELGLNPKPEK